MYSRIIFFCSFLIQTILSNESASDDFVVVSTTSRPKPADSNEEVTNRLRSLESQVVLIKKILDAYNTDLTQLKKNLQTQGAQMHKKSEDSQINFQKKKNPTQNLPTDCREVQGRGHNVSNVYFIQPEVAPEPFLVLCDMETREGGWTYILNRFNGSQDFGLNWQNYKHGFGILDGEFWLGLENVHYLTGSEINELLIELVDWDLKKVHAFYSSFNVGNEQEGYSLKLLRGYSGDAGDSFTYHLGMKFSTKDNDQDLWSGNCAGYSPAAWWYKDCDKGQLTGKYLGKTVKSGDGSKGIYWNTFHGSSYSLKEARMMVRPAV